MPTFFLPWKPNAAAQPRLEAGAQRTLAGVGCSRLFGGVALCLAPDTVGVLILHPFPYSHAHLFDHVIRLEKQRRGNRDAKGLGRLEVDDQLELRGLLHGQVRGLGALQDLVH